MSVDQLVQQPAEWLHGDGPMSDVVISSRIRLARNLAAFPFLTTASETQRTEIYRSVVDAASGPALCEDAWVVDVEQCDEIDKEVLVERHLISRQHAQGEGRRGVLISPQETLAVMVNEEDHVRMQGLRSGLQLDAVWSDVNQVDERLEELLEFAYDPQFGYLTACPTNVGTGIRVSVMLHLPALKMTQEIERVARAVQDMRLAVRGLYGEGTEAVGDFYQLSNQTTLGKSEEQIMDDFGQNIIPKIVEYERTARDALGAKRSLQLDDRIWRAFGTLSQARIISSEETLHLLSYLRLGINMGRFSHFGISTLNDLLMSTQPAHLQKVHGDSLNGEERGRLRAERLRQRMAQPGE